MRFALFCVVFAKGNSIGWGGGGVGRVIRTFFWGLNAHITYFGI